MKRLDIGSFKRHADKVSFYWFLSDQIELLSIEDLDSLMRANVKASNAATSAKHTVDTEPELFTVKPFSVLWEDNAYTSDPQDRWPFGIVLRWAGDNLCLKDSMRTVT